MSLYSESDTEPFISDFLILYGWGDCMVKMGLTGTETDRQTAEKRADEISDKLMTSLPKP